MSSALCVVFFLVLASSIQNDFPIPTRARLHHVPSDTNPCVASPRCMHSIPNRIGWLATLLGNRAVYDHLESTKQRTSHYGLYGIRQTVIHSIRLPPFSRHGGQAVGRNMGLIELDYLWLGIMATVAMRRYGNPVRPIHTL